MSGWLDKGSIKGDKLEEKVDLERGKKVIHRWVVSVDHPPLTAVSLSWFIITAIIPWSQPSQNTLSTWNDIITVYFNDISMSLWLRGVQPIQRMAAFGGASDSQSTVRAMDVSSS